MKVNKEQKILEIAYDYVLEKSGADKEKLDYYLNEWEYSKPENLNGIFKSLLNSAKNSGGMPNFIGEIESLEPFLYSFSPKLVFENYNSWEDLFDEIYNSDFKTPSKMYKINKKNSWVKYCKSVIDSAKFLARFDNISDFENYVKQFINESNPDLRIAFPLILKEEIFNVGFALACDFIKDNISPEFIKPDTHINQLFIGIGICKKNHTDFEIFRNVISFSKSTDKNPYWIDKLFWLIGSRRFYKNDEYKKEEKFEKKSSKEEFIQLINNYNFN